MSQKPEAERWIWGIIGCFNERGRFELVSTVLRPRCCRPIRTTYLIRFVRLLILPSSSSGVSLILHLGVFE
ncbi:unnamed protein product [Schistosoma intercalatum]|nr:unnamed protein product [Schistosoma intercalatum]